MRRRDFLAGFCGTAALWPLVTRAQQVTREIGFLSSVSPGPFAGELAGFKKGLTESGFVEGENLTIQYRWAENHLDRLPAMARELVARRVSVLVAAGGAPSAFAAKGATSTIPVVFAGAGDPVKLGLVASLNRPGGNVTGVSFIAVALVAKRLEMLREMLPKARSVAVVSAGQDPEEVALVRNAAGSLGFQIEILLASSDADLEKAFAVMAERRVDGALIGTGPTFLNRRSLILALATRHSIPAIYARREYVADGGLISYSPPVTDAYRHVGHYTARILRGDKPADLPVMQPTKFDLSINLKTAKALGITVPPTLLARAEEVIE